MFRCFPGEQQADFILIQRDSDDNNCAPCLRYFLCLHVLGCGIQLIPLCSLMEKALYAQDSSVAGIRKEFLHPFFQGVSFQRKIQEGQRLEFCLSARNGLHILRHPITAVHQGGIICIRELFPVFYEEAVIRCALTSDAFFRLSQMKKRFLDFSLACQLYFAEQNPARTCGLRGEKEILFLRGVVPLPPR